MSLTTFVADEFLSSKLNGDATLLGLVPSRAWRDKPPAGTAHPFVVWQFQTGTELRGAGPVRIWSDLIYAVKVVGQGANVAALKAAVDRIDALLDLGRATVGSGEIVACTLEGFVSYPETVNGLDYQHVGGRYRLLARGA